MRFLFAGTPHAALPRDVARRGHEVYFPAAADWWAAMQGGVQPVQYADRLWRAVLEVRPEVVFLHKGWHTWHDRDWLWSVPGDVLWAIRGRVGALVLACFDDPAGSPITLLSGVAAPCDLWLTSCVGIREMAAEHVPTVRVEEFWLAWDEDVAPVDDPDLRVGVALTGTPYYRPFPPPHYQYGLRTVRRELAHAAIARGLSVGIWGPTGWLREDEGGDPALGAWYRGWLDPSCIHTVHGSARCSISTHLVEGYRYESGRLPWTAGAGGVIVHEDRPGLRDDWDDLALWFPPGDLGAACDQAARVVADSELRADLSRRGRAHVLAHHCWSHRAARLADLCSEVRRR